MKIAVDLKACSTIVIPSIPTKREDFAARELVKYIRIISGAVLSIISDNEEIDGNMILVGGPERNKHTAYFIRGDRFNSTAPGPEGIMIKTYGENVLVLAGSSDNSNESERGTVYAVYEFLERYLGCSFVSYGKPGSGLGEYIPTIPSLEIGEIEYIKSKADLPYRTAIVQFDGYAHEIPNSNANHGLTVSIVDWMAKNRLNRIFLTMNSYETIKTNGVLEEIIKRGISLTVGHHDSGMFFLPPCGNEVFRERYYETHPEYYRLQADGSRFFAGTKWKGQLVYDMRNQECIRQIAENMKKWLGENPCVDVVSLWPNDGDAPQCVCEECSKNSKMTNYAGFVNEIAKLVNEEYSHVRIDMIVYLDLWHPPQGVDIGSGVLVEMSTWGPEYILRTFGKNDGTGLIGTSVEKNAMVWSRMAGGMVYYDYYMTNFDSKQVYCPMADEIMKIYESFVEKGYCQGIGTQLEAFNLWNYLLNFYVHGRKSYDVSLTIEELLERFTRIFGNGKEFIKEYIRYIEDFYEGQVPEGKDGRECAAYFATHVNREKVYDLFEKAYEAEPEGKLRDNIRLLRMAFRYSDLHCHNPGCDELLYMSNEFGSYWGSEGQIGYGIAVFDKPGGSSYSPDKWYNFN